MFESLYICGYTEWIWQDKSIKWGQKHAFKWQREAAVIKEKFKIKMKKEEKKDKRFSLFFIQMLYVYHAPLNCVCVCTQGSDIMMFLVVVVYN